MLIYHSKTFKKYKKRLFSKKRLYICITRIYNKSFLLNFLVISFSHDIFLSIFSIDCH